MGKGFEDGVEETAVGPPDEGGGGGVRGTNPKKKDEAPQGRGSVSVARDADRGRGGCGGRGGRREEAVKGDEVNESTDAVVEDDERGNDPEECWEGA